MAGADALLLAAIRDDDLSALTRIWTGQIPAEVGSTTGAGYVSRHRPRVRAKRLAGIRLAVYTHDDFRCVGCGWAPEVPADYDGSYALMELEPRPTSRDPRRTVMRYLMLDHIHPYSRGGRFTVGNLQALCTPCNNRKGASTL